MSMTAQDILDEIKPLGSERYKSVLMQNHGVREPCFGVKIADLKKIQKRIKKNHRLALDLYDTGNYDAMYLAGLIADDPQMSKADLQHWAESAYVGSLAGSTVAWVAAGSPHGLELALRWIESKQPLIALTGWATLGSLVALKEDSKLDQPELKRLLQRVQKDIHHAPDVVRYAMNGYIIAVGCSVSSLTELALQVAYKIGPVTADLGDNNCQVPSATDYIHKVQARGGIGKKRKTVKC